MSAQQNAQLDLNGLIAIQDVVHMLELRISVETDAAGFAAVRRNEDQLREMQKAMEEFDAALARDENAVEADFRFHQKIAEATGNPYFAEVMAKLGRETIPRTRINTIRLYQEQGLNYLHRTNREHRQVFDAIRRSNPEAARAAMRLHLLNSLERLRLASATTTAS